MIDQKHINGLVLSEKRIKGDADCGSVVNIDLGSEESPPIMENLA